MKRPRPLLSVPTWALELFECFAIDVAWRWLVLPAVHVRREIELRAIEEEEGQL